MKFIGDTIKAFRQASEGKKNASKRETMSPYSLPEAAVRAIGFTPGREADLNEKRSAIHSQQQGQKNARSALANDWLAAKPSQKAKAWVAIQRWNKGRPKNEQITMKDLTTQAKRRATEERNKKVVHGSRVTKRDEGILRRVEQTYR